ncbi:Hsp20 family protein [Aeromicrobium sp. SMF47]|uniref:Hsp20 family protein n=1 Tax=Aeromicrobium yanjiei TaxID=2662028 RepID=A0A5Q2MK13_9ACTN|nr:MULTISPECIES: Hsp20/alpha crystallin family protein [Aeromicrobium]MRJ77495.1 Hsp20 family protein [Aeromicrobium yanjiei]MRK01862.1 Hsp20 family protein [Aeromicrobium sp. S22]QGG41396.1 Hsp20 family protein [Aeromicrobium yanjiei]
MTPSIVRRPQGPFTDLMDWLDGEVRRVGVSPAVPIEDFVEDGQYVVRAELPGVDPDKDVSVTVEGDILTIHGERHEEKKEKNLQEHRYGSFTRKVRVPTGTVASEVKATYTNGILEVRVPVKTADDQAQKVTIERGE